MLLALDYDECFALDPLGWQDALETFKAHGHSVVGVTMRYEREKEDMSPLYFGVCEKVYFTGRLGKRKFLENLDVYPHVWVDDTPEFVVFDAKKTVGYNPDMA